MRKLELRRAYLDNCCIGKLSIGGELMFYTVERPWKSNEKSVSCVPAGRYELEPYSSDKHPDCWALKNEALGVTPYGPSQRTHCLIHVANFPHEVEGCIAPGMELHPASWGVARSRDAMEKLRVLLGNGGGWVLDVI